MNTSNPSPAPTPIASLTERAANWWFDLAVTDPANARPGLFYFVESDVTPRFNSPRIYFIGASLYVQLGNQTLYWRAYPQYIAQAARDPGTRHPPATATGGLSNVTGADGGEPPQLPAHSNIHRTFNCP